jgi:hypothetical protein
MRRVAATRAGPMSGRRRTVAFRAVLSKAGALPLLAEPPGRRQASRPALRRARLGRIPLLVVDDVGYIPFDPSRRTTGAHGRA